MSTINTGGYVPFVGGQGPLQFGTPAQLPAGSNGPSLASANQAYTASEGIGANLGSIVSDPSQGPDLSSMSDAQKKAYIEKTFGSANAPAILNLLQQNPNVDLTSLAKLGDQNIGPALKVLNQNPSLDLQSLAQVGQQDPHGLTTMLDALAKHPQWNPDDLLTTDANGKTTVSPIVKDPEAMQLMDSRQDIQPQDLAKMENSLSDAVADGSGKSDPNQVQDMLHQACQLMTTRTDIKPDQISDIAGTCQKFFGDKDDPNSSQNVQMGFDKVCGQLAQNKNTTPEQETGMMNTLQNHFQNSKQRSQAFDSASKLMGTSGFDNTTLDNMLSNSQRQGKEGSSLLKDFNQNVQGVKNGTASLASVGSTTGFGKDAPTVQAQDRAQQSAQRQEGRTGANDQADQGPVQQFAPSTPAGFGADAGTSAGPGAGLGSTPGGGQHQ